MNAPNITLRQAPRTGLFGTIAVLLLLGFCAVVGVMLAQLHNDAWVSAKRGAENLLAALSQDLQRSIQSFDLSLQAVRDGLKLPGIDRLSPELRQAALFDRSASAGYLGTMVVLNEHGDIVEDAGSVPPRQANLAGREYFQALRDDRAIGLYISRPFRRMLPDDGELVVAMARRIEKEDGSFGGVVVGSLELRYFQDLFRKLNLGPKGMIGLQRRDGTVLNRYPYDEAVVGRNLSGTPGFEARRAQRSGMWRGETPVDGISRVFFFTQVHDLPLLLTVGISERDIYESWVARTTVIVGVLLALCAAAIALFLLFLQQLTRRARAEADLLASETQYRLLADHATDLIMRLSPELVRRYVSPSCRAMLGYDPAELIGHSAQNYVHPEDWPGVFRRSQTAYARGEGFAAIYRMRHKSGSWVWVEGNFSLAPEGEGGFIAVVRDIGPRKEAELRLAAAHAELTRLATTDGMTGLANRRRLDAVMEQEWRRAARDGLPLSLLLMDADMFKSFNDRYGHQAGDDCLRAVANCVAAHARRPADVAARYGGEELALLLPDTGAEQAAQVAERVRESIVALGIPHDGNPSGGGMATVSVGVAAASPYPGPDGAPATPVSSLIAAADRALYAAKNAGRNRVEVAGPIRTMEPVGRR